MAWFSKEIPKGKRGRKPIKGKRIQLKQLLTDSQQTWQSLTVQSKNELTFADVIGAIRRSIWFQKYFSKS